jgi:hypothetical protein
MPDQVGEIKGKVAHLSLNGGQRLVIETAHGLIEIKPGRPNTTHLDMTLPPDLRFRKGPADALQLHLRFFEVVDDVPQPQFQLLGLQRESDGGFYLRPVEALRVE